jgi:molybdopterin molybdotransferase
VSDPRAMDQPPLPFEAARDTILAAVEPLPTERVRALDAAGRTLAADVVAPEDLPRFAISAMDGYAIPADVLHALVSAGGVQARLAGEIAAGSPEPNTAPAPGEVLRIFTGGAVPAWTAAVVMQEQGERTGDAVVLRGPVSEGQHIRLAGGDVRAGAIVLRSGARIHPPDVALLAALGVAEVAVGRRPRVGVITTGAELSDDADPRPGQIRDSNAPMLEAAARACGAGEVRRDRAGDSQQEIEAAASGLLGRVDALCISGGVSVGDHDHVKAALAALGVARVFWRVAQRPGKPFYFGTWRATPVFGLPGNPASSLATFLALVWPALRRLEGLEPAVVRRRARLTAAATKARGLTAFLRGRTLPGSVDRLVEPSGDQDSHLIRSFSAADCLIVCPPHAETLAPGVEVDVLPFPWAER